MRVGVKFHEDGCIRLAMELEINGRWFAQVTVDLLHIRERHGDHVDVAVITEVLANMSGLDARPATVAPDGTEFFAVHIQASNRARDGLYWYLVRFKVDDELFVRTIHRDRSFRPKRIRVCE